MPESQADLHRGIRSSSSSSRARAVLLAVGALAMGIAFATGMFAAEKLAHAYNCTGQFPGSGTICTCGGSGSPGDMARDCDDLATACDAYPDCYWECRVWGCGGQQNCCAGSCECEN